MANRQLLIVGLGNVTHPGTRHSVGHLLVGSLASRLGVSLSLDRRWDGFSAQRTVTIGGNSIDITLFKPLALMNISGRPVANALRSRNLSPSSLVVIHDALDVTPGTMKYKFGGSPDGHNGLRSIISALGGDKAFHRLRIGIGRGDGDVAGYVLSRLPSYERQFWGDNGPGVDLVWREIEKIAGTGLDSR